MSVELRDLRWAIVAAQHRSLRQAAETLNVRQSTLSRGLRGLEQQLGAVLFERTNGGTRPTLEGQEFLEAARRIVDETNAITERLRTRARGESGRLTVGTQASFSTGNLRSTLIEHRRRYPEVETQLVDGSCDHLVSDLTSSAVDIAFVADGRRSWDGRALAVWSERVVVAIPDGHALSKQDIVRWDDLKREPMLLSQRGPGPELKDLLAQKLGWKDQGRLYRHDISLDRLLSLVCACWGISLILEGATGISYPGVTFRYVCDGDGPTRMEFCALWRETNPNPSLRPLLEILRERYPDLTEPEAK